MINRRLQHGYRSLVVLPALLVLTCILCGCITSESAPELVEKEFIPVSAVSVTQPGFEVKSGDTYGWRSEMLWIGEDADGPYRQALTQLNIGQEIDRQLAARGLVKQSLADAELVLIAAVRIGNDDDSAAVTELARLYPSLGSVSMTLERGTLLVALARSGSPVVLWRGAIETFISGDVEPEKRRARLEIIVRSLLNTLPQSDAPVQSVSPG